MEKALVIGMLVACAFGIIVGISKGLFWVMAVLKMAGVI